MTACKPAPIQRPPLTPNVLGVTKKKSDTESKANDIAPQEQGAAGPPSEKESPAGPPKTKEGKESCLQTFLERKKSKRLTF